jgi:hypothetical protein
MKRLAIYGYYCSKCASTIAAQNNSITIISLTEKESKHILKCDACHLPNEKSN